jgi:hypothetical protein
MGTDPRCDPKFWSEEASMRLRKSVVLLAAALLFGCCGLFAQTPTGEVNGTVVDSSGGTVPGADVKAINQDTNIVSETNTNQDGAFTIVNLPPGNYVLTVEKAGFKSITLPVFALDVDQTLTEKLALQVGSSSETVTVTAQGALLQSSSAELGTTIEQQMVGQLPLNGRNFTELEIDQPGVGQISTAQSSTPGSSDGSMMGIPGTITYKVSINGAENRSTEYFLDGIINSDFRISAYAYLPIVDTIDEFKIQSHNSDAEYGGVLGGIVNLATKGGGNQFHGSGWEFARSQIFDARNPFTGFCNAAQCPAGAAAVAAGTETAAQFSGTPVSPLGYSQNEFGGTFGGPIFKNKTFFYVAYEGWRYSKPTNAFTVDPTAQELTGDFSGTSSQCITYTAGSAPVCGDGASPELIGTVNSAKTGVVPNVIYNPFAEAGNGSSAFFRCATGTDTPLALSNPAASFGQAGYGQQLAGGTPCDVIPSALVDAKIAKVVSAYTAGEASSCAFSPVYAGNVDNCLDSRPTTDDSENMDARIDQHFGTKDTLFGRASMFWDTDTTPVTGTTSITPSIFHAWNIGGAWDHAFTPNLIFEARGGVNSKPYEIAPTNPAGYAPETAAGLPGLAATDGAYLDLNSGTSVYPSIVGPEGPELRGNPIDNVESSLTWIHGKHNFKMGFQWMYENRLQTGLYSEFNYSPADTCPTNSSGIFTCSGAEGNALASALLDLPSAYTADLVNYDIIHIRVTTYAGYFQDEWHVRPNLTVNLGLRYDYDPAVVNLATSLNGSYFNALDLPAHEYIIRAQENVACGNPVVPPCIPGGPAANIADGSSIAVSSTQPYAKSVGDNIGPRIGFAWGFAHNTVLRVGYGIYYDTMSGRSQWAQNGISGSLWPFTSGVIYTTNQAPVGTAPTATLFPICSSAASCGATTAAYTNSSFGALIGQTSPVINPTPWADTGYTNDPTYSDPKSQQWQVDIERQLSANSMFSIAYVGSKSTRLDYTGYGNEPVGPFCENANQCSSPVTAVQANSTEYLPFATDAEHYEYSNAISNYNSLQAQYQKRFSNGLSTLVAFTWSKCLATSSGYFNAENGFESDPVEDFFNPSLAYGVCAFDIPKDFNLSGNYDLPFGKGERWLSHDGPLTWILGNWEVNFSFIARSGQAFDLTWNGAASTVPSTIGGLATVSADPASLSDSSGSMTNYSRPSQLPGCQIYGGQSLTQWYNPACFVSPASTLVGPGYGFGDSPVGGMRTQIFNDTDFSLIKNIPIKESMNLQLRFEGFNVFNHVVWGEPGVTDAPTFSSATNAVSYGSAGVISSIASTPRELQLAAKFSF